MEESCSSKLTQWQQYVTKEQFHDLPFQKLEDGQMLLQLWEQHHLVITTLLV
jgi:hypothetical protein